VRKGGFMAGEAVTIKGTSDGLVITLGPGSLEEVLKEMNTRLGARASFFVGGRVALQVGDRPLSSEQLLTIGSALEQAGVTLWAVDGSHPTTFEAARELGLESRLAGAAPEAPAADETSLEEMTGIVVRKTLRSGQAIHHAGHITVIGDLNSGAELVAGGDIVVWGALRGTVHAGAMGDEGALVCALQLAPDQIRIGSIIARSPERGRPPTIPETARVQEGRIVVEQWNLRRKQLLEFGDWRSGLGRWGSGAPRKLRALLGQR
jgi:septum site-determining protein MinC